MSLTLTLPGLSSEKVQKHFRKKKSENQNLKEGKERKEVMERRKGTEQSMDSPIKQLCELDIRSPNYMGADNIIMYLRNQRCNKKMDGIIADFKN